MEFDALTLVLLMVAVPASFVLSAAAGLGGSLILVPTLMMGPKEGVALAALLLAVNNLAKLTAYRKTLPIPQAAMITLAVMLGATAGASLMVMAPETWVRNAVIVMLVLTFAGDIWVNGPVRRVWAVVLALTSGATSGFSGTAGPLKGVALRSLALNRQYFVGAAAIVSLAGDMTKTVVFTHSGLLGEAHLLMAAALIPVMILCTLGGRRLNRRVGEQGYAILFWTVMAGYVTRLVVTA